MVCPIKYINVFILYMLHDYPCIIPIIIVKIPIPNTNKNTDTCDNNTNAQFSATYRLFCVGK